MLRICICILICLSILSCNKKKATQSQKKPEVEQIKVIKKKADTRIKFYLTFDDGPYHTTPNLIGVLKELNVKSSFFIIGSQVEFSPFFDSLFNAEKQISLFKVYNHTYTHAVTHGRIKKYYADPENVLADIQRNKDVIKTGGNITRLPGKNTWRVGVLRNKWDDKTKKLIDLLDSTKNNENIIGWDIEWTLKQSGDKNKVDSLFNLIYAIANKNNTEKKDIVMLSHDYLYRTPASLENLRYLVGRLKNELHCSFNWVEEMDGISAVDGGTNNK